MDATCTYYRIYDALLAVLDELDREIGQPSTEDILRTETEASLQERHQREIALLDAKEAFVQQHAEEILQRFSTSGRALRGRELDEVVTKYRLCIEEAEKRMSTAKK